jgi:hypothetical protein
MIFLNIDIARVHSSKSVILIRGTHSELEIISSGRYFKDTR